MAKSSPTLGTFSTYVASILEISKLFVHSLYLYFEFPKAIKSMLYLFIFWELSEPSGA